MFCWFVVLLFVALAARAPACHTGAALRQAFDDIVEELSSQYLVTYAPPSAARDGAWHDIRVEVADGRDAVRSRQGYRREK